MKRPTAERSVFRLLRLAASALQNGARRSVAKLRSTLEGGVRRVKTVVMQRMMRFMMGRMARADTEGMMRHTMPRMMDACFSTMDVETRTVMLAHCRGMLDEIEAKYVRTTSPADGDG